MPTATLPPKHHVAPDRAVQLQPDIERERRLLTQFIAACTGDTERDCWRLTGLKTILQVLARMEQRDFSALCQREPQLMRAMQDAGKLFDELIVLTNRATKR